MGSLRAGAARVDVTPPKEMFPLKTAQPFGSFEKAHDPIYARALVLDNGKTKLAIIGVDILDWQEDGLLEDIAAALQIPPENVILNPSHDDSSLHNTGPRPGRTEMTQESPAIAIMKKGMIEAAREANANLQPARIGFGTGRAEVNTNRNDRNGASDKTVTVLLLTKPSGEPIAVYTSYAVHSIVMVESGTDDGKVQLTSDLAGWTQRYVEDHFPGSVALWAVSAGGDQAPLLTSRSTPPYEAHNFGSAGWTLLDAQSRLLGAEVVRVAKAIQSTSGRVVLWAARSSVTCPAPQRVPQVPQQDAAPGAGQGNGGQNQGTSATGGPGEQPAAEKGGGQAATAQNRTLTIPLQLLMVNDIAIAGINGDPAAEIGLQFRHDSLFDQNMLVTMIPNSLGHLQSDKQGCTNRAIDDEFQKMMKSYLAVWDAAQ